MDLVNIEANIVHLLYHELGDNNLINDGRMEEIEDLGRDVEPQIPHEEELDVDDEDENPDDDDWGGQVQVQDEGEAEEANWNPMDWDRAEELTWERLLGLDGSLVFLEHVFWVVSLNTLFIMVSSVDTLLSTKYLFNVKFKYIYHYYGFVTSLN